MPAVILISSKVLYIKFLLQLHYFLINPIVRTFEAAALLALHTFCYSNRLDFERLNRIADDSGEGAAFG
jgi:hypothetical protein